jgi:hypothetical protein
MHLIRPPRELPAGINLDLVGALEPTILLLRIGQYTRALFQISNANTDATHTV